MIPADASPAEASPVVAWTSGDNTARTELGWNTAPSQGSFGALRLSTPHGYLVGSTPLRDGKWHHVAVILNHAARAPEHVHVTFYLDGRLEGIASKHLQKRSTKDVLLKSGTLWAGKTSGSASESSGFRGALDELVMTDRALAPEEVRLLMRENKIGSGDSEVF